MTPFVYSVIGVLLSYIVGSIPTGLWLGLKLRNVDIRQHGSQNIGATNTMRVLGKKLGAIALLCDMLKGLIPVLIATVLSPWPHLPLLCGLAAVLGHSFSLFLQFKGGKGVATSTGIFLGLAPVPTLIAAGVFAGVLAVSRMVSAASMSAVLGLSIAMLACPDTDLPLRILTITLSILILIKHRTNIQRILHGNENKL